ncbi:hypothetical protein [Wenjunlia tyrosinilytica]|uniref:Uncharacterized protein n=1 Tax=Wenjunlia tyrosinilytica TaxID=1544741 RepID=A0A918DSP6_9ACTN|nr:hypothetical protein [Wenjunlia tyrosinilytica]GGO80775.1 hypothetical protein GCM10012280_03480 [Wenjunlia tyrosinilytica]
MSTPPDQPSAYPYPSPQSPGGYGSPTQPAVPGQHNPYAQTPNPYAQPGAYGSAGMPPQPPGTPGYGGGGAKRALLWAAVGAVAASAVWGAGLLAANLVGGDTTAGDLGSYKFQDNLCDTADISSMKQEYPEADSNPTHESLKHEATDSMSCSLTLKKSGSSTYADAYLSLAVEYHKKSDPTADFTALWESYKERTGSDYKVEKIDGYGDQAYLVTLEPASSTGTRSATLAVRDGSVTYNMSWSAYPSSLTTSTIPAVSDIAAKLKTDTKATLAKLSD